MMAKAAKIHLTSAHMDRLLTGADIRIPLDADVSMIILSMKEDAQLAGLADIIARMERLGAKLGRGAQTFVKELLDDMLVDRKKDKHSGPEFKDKTVRPRCRQ